MKCFNGDGFLLYEIKKLVDQFHIKTIIETGTHNGSSTKCFAKMCSNVITIEVNESYYKNCLTILSDEMKTGKVKIFKGSSPIMIKEIDKNKLIDYPVLFYLDAHWYKYNPLFDEFLSIQSLHDANKNCLLVIHDFKVPDKDFGYDKFPNGKKYEWNNIAKHIDNIYGSDGYNYYYNNEAEGAKRGVVFITPKNVKV